jgi:hypothetical protein
MAPLQARREHNPRHFHKLVWQLPIPLYDGEDPTHRRLVELAAQAETVAADVDVSKYGTFQAQRRLIREELVRQGLAAEIDDLVMFLVQITEAQVGSSAVPPTRLPVLGQTPLTDGRP